MAVSFVIWIRLIFSMHWVDPTIEFFHDKGLFNNEIIGTTFDEPGSHFGIPFRGNADDGQVFLLMGLPDFLAQIISIHPRHVVIGYHKLYIRMLLQGP